MSELHEICQGLLQYYKRFGTVLSLALFASVTNAQVSVTTWHNDIGRTGQNLNETILNTADVNSTQFGKLFSQPVDGYVYAQPLYLPSVTIGGQSHNVMFVATEHDSVYAFDADNNGGTNAVPLWFASMLTAAHGAATGATSVPSADVGTDIIPEIGITGTPVIDPTTGTLYVVSKTVEGSSFVQRLHALDITSGMEKFGGPVTISASVPGTGNGSVNGVLAFDSEWENQRPSLLLLNGIIYIGFASHGDNGPWHGWILSYNAQTLQQAGAFCTTHNGVGGGTWMSGAGLAAEVPDPVNHPYGRMFVATGNGDYTASTPYTNNMDFGDSILNLDLTNGAPTVEDEFTPYNQVTLDANDSDVASGGVLLLPTQTSGKYPHLLAQTGKSGTLYLLNRDGLGGYNSSGDQVAQELTYAVGANGAWSTAAFWKGTVYYWGVSDTLKAFPLVNGQLTGPTAVSSETYGYPGASPSISANGNSQGIIWTIESDAYATQGPAVLQAHNATNPATTLYSSSTNPSRDAPGAAVKYTTPTIANGKVYVGTENQVSVFGLLNGQQVATAPVISPAGESFNGSLSVSMTDSTPGATIYYTLDGTPPTASSLTYTNPITLTASTTIQAIASASGFLQSAVTSEPYVDSSQVSTPVVNPGTGTYTEPELVTMSDSTTGATIYYTTDGTTPNTSSSVYSSPITVSASETLNAIAIASGFANSPEVSANYTLNIGQTGISFPEGFAGTQSVMILNGSSQLNDSRLQLTSGLTGQAGSAWYYQQVNIQAFTTEFSFQLSNPVGDGMTFAIQSQSLNALGQAGGGLGYQGLPSSIAIKFDLFSNAGEGPDSTGLYINGASPTVPANNLSSTGIDLHSDDTMDILLTYNGTILTMTITDMVTGSSYTTSWSVNIPGIVGGNTAWVGFTGGTGGSTSSQKILTWSYSVGSNAPSVLIAPTFTPAAGSYSSAQSITISDSTAGATIYYTTDGSTPTVLSSVYSGPVMVSASETVNAIAVETGYTVSPVATAAYTIAPALSAPTFTPVAGTYTTAQSVTINAPTGATIYYTTNGTTPSTSSSVYSGPITVNSTETLEAIAVQSGFINSAAAISAYTINSSGTILINYPSNNFTSANLSLNYGASISSGTLLLTDSGPGEDRSAFFTTAVPVQSFITNFTFLQLNATADGMTFTIQGVGPGTVGGNGGGLGYQGIPKSVAIKFDLFSNAGEGSDSTGLYTNGATPTVPAIDLSSTAINLHAGHVMQVQMVYDGTNLTMTLTDTVTSGTVTEVFPVNIPGIVGGNTAYVGFTGGTGGGTSTQEVISWTYVSSTQPFASAPLFSPTGGTYSATQTVSISDSTPGATIYYTTNGTTPTTTSNVYSSGILVNASETLEAMAVKTGYNNSSISTAAYVINSGLPAPTFSPLAGTYSSPQSVTINDQTPGTTIYYTTNGIAPTASSSVYSSAITVSASETVQALAVETGYANSPTATASYTISAALPAPTFSPVTGTYSSSQSVTISDQTPGTTIYYTTNGTMPTTSSNVYSSAITVGASETLQAIAVESGYNNSPVASSVYTITSGGNTYINYPTGQFSASSLYLNNGPTVTPGGILQITDGGQGESRSAWFTTEVPIQSFITDFTFQQINATADGMTFTIQGQGAGSLGNGGGGLGYQGIPTSAAIKFDLFNNGSEGIDSTGLYINGAAPTIPAVNLSSTGINLHSGDIMHANITYDGTNLTMTLTDTATSATVTETFPANLPGLVGGNTAYVGFTGGTGGSTATQNILSWTFTSLTQPPAAAPTFSPAAGSYTSPQTVTISDTTPSVAIYYTTNGTVPTTSSNVYISPISVSTSETLQAIAVEAGYTNSGVSAASYTISQTLPAPVISLAAGVYGTPQSVTISDAIAGTTIYYTTDGTVPTASSAIYNKAITVNASEVLQAIAIESGYTNSSVTTASYTISSSSTIYINYASGKFTPTSLYLNNGPTVTTDGLLRLTDGGSGESRSAWFTTEVPVQKFTTDFTFQQLNATADGMTFAIQGQGAGALGYSGSGLGYQSIPNSVALKFDLYNNAGEGNDSTGLYTGGTSPTVPFVDLSSTAINLHSGDVMDAHIVYDGTNLTMTLTDMVTNGTVTEVFPINIPSIIGATTAYVGFTGGTGGMSATQNVLSWSYLIP